MTIHANKITGVPETMLYTLYLKCLETLRPGGIIGGRRYRDIVDRIDADFTRFVPYPQGSPLLFACRSLLFDREAEDFVARVPDATVVSFGSGLDFRFERVDNGRISWFDVDLPEVIELRRKLFGESDRCRCIPKSALDFSWADDVGHRGAIYFLAEGLFVYFTEDEIACLLQFILDRYPHALLLLDGYSSFYINSIREGTPYGYLNEMQRLWRWSVDGFYQLERLSPGLSLEKELHPMEMFGYRRYLFPEGADPDYPAHVMEQITGMIKIFLLRLDGSGEKGHDGTDGMDDLFGTINEG